jgi:hypothetical protein
LFSIKLGAGIARGVGGGGVCIRLGHPTKKMSLCEALHGRAAMARVEAPWPAMGSSLERNDKGKGRGGAAVGEPWGGGGLHEGRHGDSACCSVVFFILYVRKN